MDGPWRVHRAVILQRRPHVNKDDWNLHRSTWKSLPWIHCSTADIETGWKIYLPLLQSRICGLSERNMLKTQTHVIMSKKNIVNNLTLSLLLTWVPDHFPRSPCLNFINNLTCHVTPWDCDIYLSEMMAVWAKACQHTTMENDCLHLCQLSRKLIS